MSKHRIHISCSNYIVCGMILGTAIGTAASIMMKQKRHKKPCLREKAVNALDVAGTVMHNLADIAK